MARLTLNNSVVIWDGELRGTLYNMVSFFDLADALVRDSGTSLDSHRVIDTLCALTAVAPLKWAHLSAYPIKSVHLDMLALLEYPKNEVIVTMTPTNPHVFAACSGAIRKVMQLAGNDKYDYAIKNDIKISFSAQKKSLSVYIVTSAMPMAVTTVPDTLAARQRCLTKIYTPAW